MSKMSLSFLKVNDYVNVRGGKLEMKVVKYKDALRNIKTIEEVLNELTHPGDRLIVSYPKR